MTGQENPRHNLRLTQELKARLAHAAIDNGRSVNAEILDRLERSFEPDPAARLVDVLSFVTSLSESDRGELLGHLAQAIAVLSKTK